MNHIIAITCQNRKTLSGHAGKCRNFLLYTVEDKKILSKELLELSEEESLHNAFHSPDMIGRTHPIFNVDFLLTGGIGMGAINKLKLLEVATYIIKEEDPDLAVEKLLLGTLEALNPTQAQPEGACNCGGEGHHHKH